MQNEATLREAGFGSGAAGIADYKGNRPN